MKNISKSKELKVQRFAEELSWVLNTHKDVTLKDLCQMVLQTSEETSTRHGLRSNTAYLVGVLPKMFQDKELFSNNTDMLDFAENVLKLQVNRAGNRSRMEYIGMIVCQVSNSDRSDLDILVEALENILSNENSMKEIKRSHKEANFSWNEIIERLGRK